MSEEHNVDENKESSDSFNRRSFVKALGGAGGGAVAGRMFASGAQAAAPLQSSSRKREPITGRELNQLTREVMEQKDVTNVMDATMRETFQNGTAVELPQGKGSSSAAREDAPSDLGEDEAVVSAVRHTLESGNKMTALAYVTGGGQAIVYYGFDEEENGLRNQAKLMSFEPNGNTDDGDLVVEETSANGELTRSLSPSPLANCEGCPPGPGNYGSYEAEDCVNMSVYCFAPCCGAFCSWVSQGCMPCLIACGMTWCMGCVNYCCQEWGTSCFECGGM